MSKMSLLIMSGAIGLFCASSEGILAQAAPPNFSKTNMNEWKPPFSIPKSGNFTYRGKSPRGDVLMEVTWKASPSQPKADSVRIFGDVKYKNPKTGMMDSLVIDENKSYILKNGKLYFALHAFSDKALGPVDLVALEDARLTNSDKSAKDKIGSQGLSEKDVAPSEDKKQKLASDNATALESVLENTNDPDDQESYDGISESSSSNMDTEGFLSKKFKLKDGAKPFWTPNTGAFRGTVNRGGKGYRVKGIWKVSEIQESKDKVFIKGHVTINKIDYAMNRGSYITRDGELYWSTPWLGKSVFKATAFTHKDISLKNEFDKTLRNVLNTKSSEYLKKDKKKVPISVDSAKLFNFLSELNEFQVARGKGVVGAHVKEELTRALKSSNNPFIMKQSISLAARSAGIYAKVNQGVSVWPTSYRGRELFASTGSSPTGSSSNGPIPSEIENAHVSNRVEIVIEQLYRNANVGRREFTQQERRQVFDQVVRAYTQGVGTNEHNYAEEIAEAYVDVIGMYIPHININPVRRLALVVHIQNYYRYGLRGQTGTQDQVFRNIHEALRGVGATVDIINRIRSLLDRSPIAGRDQLAAYIGVDLTLENAPAPNTNNLLVRAGIAFMHYFWNNGKRRHDEL